MITTLPLRSVSPTVMEQGKEDQNARSMKIRVVNNSNERMQTLDHCLGRVKSWILGHPVVAGLIASALITGSLLGLGLGVGLGAGASTGMREKQCSNGTFYFDSNTILIVKEKDRKQLLYCNGDKKYSKLELTDCQLKERGSMDLSYTCFQKKVEGRGSFYQNVESKNFIELKNNLMKSKCIVINPDLSRDVIPCIMTL